MTADKEFTEGREYIKNLKSIRSEVFQIIREEDSKAISEAAEYYPVKLNHLLMQRNIRSVSGVFPFMDLAMLDQRKQNPDLIDLNAEKDDTELLWEVIRAVDRELDQF